MRIYTHIHLYTCVGVGVCVCVCLCVCVCVRASMYVCKYTYIDPVHARVQVAQRIDEHAKQEAMAERERERAIAVWLVSPDY